MHILLSEDLIRTGQQVNGSVFLTFDLRALKSQNWPRTASFSPPDNVLFLFYLYLFCFVFFPLQPFRSQIKTSVTHHAEEKVTVQYRLQFRRLTRKKKTFDTLKIIFYFKCIIYIYATVKKNHYSSNKIDSDDFR